MLVEVNGIDITEHIIKKSYSVNSESIYNSWLDGNSREHRIYTRKKVSGSFEVVLYGKGGMTTQAFLQNWNEAVQNNVVTLYVYVNNDDKMEPIEAFYEITGEDHRELNNGDYCNILTIKIEER